MKRWNTRKGTGHGSSSSDGTSPENTSVSQAAYARKCRELLALNKELEELGAGAFFALPRVAVIGSQSAGKSSLVEAVSEINVPRDSGTCTRCPMYCEMTGGVTWSCTISLRKHESDGKSYESSPFSPEIFEKSSVELWIRRAQAAILSPHRSSDDFYKMSRTELGNLLKTDKDMQSFSNDVVEIHLKGPGLTDLSFIDLPGLIQNASPETVQLVKDLSLSYISGDGSENTLILVTLPMSDDIQNQAAAHMARNCDANGDRTIGVVTKPDVPSAGSTGLRQQWLTIIENSDKNEEHYLRHGYYCVRLPDDAERARNLDREQSQRIASDFFNKEPWIRFPDRKRFGIPNLVSDVSQLLVDLIESNLPELKDKVKELLKITSDELSRLPPPPSSEPSVEVARILNGLCDDIRRAVMGEANKGVARKSRSIYAQLKRDIWRTGLDFHPYTSYQQGGYSSADLDGFNDTVVPSPERSATPNSAMETLNLLDVRAVIVNSIGWELPGHVPFEATKELVRRSTCKWREPSITCFNTVYENMDETVQTLTAARLSQYPLLKAFVDSYMQEKLIARKEEVLITLEKVIKTESDPLYTQNYHEYDAERRKWHAHFHPARYASDGIYRATSFEYDYEDERNLMAGVRAYFKVAFKRYIDVIPLLIEHELNQTFASDLFEKLFGYLLDCPDTSARMKELVSEDPIVAEKRKALEKTIDQLKAIEEKLAAY